METRKLTATINGTEIYYEDVGEGEPIIFSHCLLWNTSLYDAQVAALRGQYRCISYDHRGQGKSADHESDEISVELLCDDVAELIKHLGLPPVHFVGHSLGGFVGIMLAARYPELVRTLVLCNTSADEEPQRNLFKLRLMNCVARLLGSKLVADSLVEMIFQRKAISSEENRQKFRDVIVNNRRTVWRAANGVINRPSQHGSLQHIRARTLVITADGDKTRTRNEAQRIAAGIAGARLLCLSTGGHMLPLEEPKLVTDAITEFLNVPVAALDD